jgi:hypothetical protein
VKEIEIGSKEGEGRRRNGEGERGDGIGRLPNSRDSIPGREKRFLYSPRHIQTGICFHEGKEAGA